VAIDCFVAALLAMTYTTTVRHCERSEAIYNRTMSELRHYSNTTNVHNPSSGILTPTVPEFCTRSTCCGGLS